MKIARWGNSLAVRLPAETVNQLGLKEGDNVEVTLRHADGFEDDLGRIERRNAAIKRMEARQWVLPPDWKTDRDDLHERG